MVLIMALFAVGIIVYSGVSFRNEKISEALKDSAMLADSVASEHEKMVADIRQLMLALAQLPDIRNLNATGMQRILEEVLSANPKYSNIFIADRTGRVLASAVPAKNTNVSDRRHFINALTTGRFSSGEFIISKFTGKPVLAFGYPLKDRQGKILGVIVMGIDMGHYRTLLDTLQLPEGSSYLLLDHKGTIMTRGIKPTDFVGEQYETAGFKGMVEGPDKDTFVAVAHDGIKRFISYRKVRLEDEQTPYMYIRSGIPVATALSVANKTLVRNLTLLVVSLCFFVVFILFIAKHSIIDRIALLEMASRRLADGDTHVKVSDLVSGGELGRLGSTFDHMARKIASREEALSESKQRYQALFEQSPYGVLLIDTEGKLLDFNEKAHRDLGYARDEFARLTIADIDTHESAPMIKTRIIRVLEAGSAEFEVTQRTKQGEIRDVHVITKALTFSGQTLFHSIWRDITERKRAQAEKDRLLEAISSATEGIAITDEDDRFIYSNDAHARIYGYLPDELIGKTWRDLITPAIVPAVEDLLSKTLHKKEVGAWSGESPAIKKDGSIIPTEVTATSRWGEDGRYLGHICIVRDITDRKRAEKTLRQSEDKFRTLFESATDAIFILNTEGRFININRTAYERLGYTREEMMSMHISQLDPPEFAPRVPERIEEVIKNGHAVFESAHLKKDGTAMPVEINCRLIDYEGGKALFSIIRDITERKRVEDKLRFFSEAVEEAPDGVQIADLSGRIIYSNKAIEKIYGFSPQEYSGRHVNEMNADPEFAEKFILPRIRETGQWTGELMVKHKDGGTFPIWLTTSLVKNKAGEPIAMMGIIRDITGRKKTEEEIMKLNRALLRRASELESAYRDMESFSYAASHDLKAPIIRIAGFTDILSEDYIDRLDDYGRECLIRISKNAGKMRQLIEDLLAFSSISAKEIQKSSIDMELLIRSAYEEIKPAGRNIQLQIEAMPSAYGDLSLIRQVLLNLLANAIKFTRFRETAVIEVGGRTEKDEHMYYVRDNGTGFDMRFVDKLFGLFQRIHISEEFEGTGIGLVIVKRIIEKHGGSVWAEGRPDEGATFYFSLLKK